MTLYTGAKWAACSVWDWCGRVDDYRGRLGVIVAVPTLIAGGLLLILRGLGVVDSLFAVAGGVAVLVGGFVLISFLVHQRAEASSQSERVLTEKERLAELRRMKQQGDVYVVRWHEGPAYPASRAAMGPTWYHGGWEEVRALREELRRFLAAELPEFRLPQIQYHGHPPDMAAATKDLADDMKELAKFIARYGGRIGQ